MIEEYTKDIGHVRFLSREEEHELALLVKAGDQKARETLIRSMMPFVVRLASNYCNRHPRCRLDDAISHGNVGLIRAVDQFDPHRGRRLSTYASFKIKQCIAYYHEQDSTVKVPHYILRGNSNKVNYTPEQRLTWIQLFHCQLSSLSNNDVDHPIIEDNSYCDEIEHLHRLIKQLNPLHRIVIRMRLRGRTFEHIARCFTRRGYKMTRQYVQQEQVKAIEQLQKQYT